MAHALLVTTRSSCVLSVDLRRVRGRYVGPPLPRYPDGS
jgi:hypothetical protein